MSTEKRIYRIIELVCQECNTLYSAKSRKSKYCSPGCKQIAYNKRNLLYKGQQPDRNRLEELERLYAVLEYRNTQLSKDNFYLRKDKENLLRENSELRKNEDRLYNKLNRLMDMYDETKLK